MKKYSAFGLTIASELALYCAESETAADVEIRFGECPEMSEEPLVNAKWVKSSIHQACVEIANVGKFYIHDGREIIMNILPEVSDEVVRLYLLGTCMGAILQQRGVIPIHGSCVCKDGKALLITGNSGAGKSTLAAEFLSKGWKLMSDDVTPVTCEDGVYYAQSTYPGQKMWQDTIDRSHNESRVVENIIRAEGGREKFQLHAGDSFVYAKVPLCYGVFLIPGSKELYLQSVTGFAKTDVLMRNLYRRFMVADKVGQSAQLKTCVMLGQQMQIFLAERPLDEFTEKRIADWLIGEMEKSESDAK